MVLAGFVRKNSRTKHDKTILQLRKIGALCAQDFPHKA
jgi:hypothetical protein